MKSKLTCERFKPMTKTGKTEKCSCKYLNRNAGRETKLYKQFMKSLDKKK